MDAAALIREDAYSSRGGVFNSISSTADLRHQLDDELELQARATSRLDKGKGRADEDDDGSDDDDIGWEPPPTHEQAERRRLSGEAQYQYTTHPDTDLSRNLNHSRRRSGTGSIGSMDSRKRSILWWRSAGINVLFIGAWYTFSTLISVYNKWMFSEDHYNFRFPLFVTSVHMLVQWLLSSLTLALFKGLRSSNRPHPRDYGTKVIPCGMATGLDIGLSNLSLRTITLSFYTMCKSSSLAFVLLFAFLFKLETPSWRLAGIILIITGGVVLMVSTETQFNLAGMVEVLSASALGGLRWSLTQILLDKESMGMSNPIATLFWLAPIMGVTLAATSMIVDGWGNVFAQEEFFGSFGLTLKTSLTIFFPGVIAFAMNVTEFGLIQRTSVVTLSVAGIFKEVAVIFLSMFIFHDQLTPINVSGLCVTIFGIALYNYLKYIQFTKGEGGGGHGHGRPKPGFVSVADESQAEEEEMMLSPRAQRAARLLGITNDSATDFHDDEFQAPLHSLGNSSHGSSSSSRSSLDDPSKDGGAGLHRATSLAKAQEHERGRVEGLEAKVRNAEEEEKEKELVQRLESGIREHREAEEWDLLGEDVGGDGKKGV